MVLRDERATRAIRDGGGRYSRVVAGRFDEDRWRHHATLVAQFLELHRRLPTPGDGPIGQWLSTQRSGLHAGSGALTAERQAILDDVAPGWRAFLPAPGVPWRTRVAHLRLLRESEGRWPSQLASNDEERQLGEWLSMQRSKAHRGELEESRRAALDAAVPGWDPGSRESAWRANADALGAFKEEHGRWPSKHASDPNERRLGAWLHNRRQDARIGSGWSSDRARYLANVAPGWNR